MNTLIPADPAASAPAAQGRKYVVWSSLAAMVGTSVYEMLKELLVPNISRWHSHAVTVGYATVGVAIVAALVHRSAGRMRHEVRTLQGWGQRSEAALRAFVDARPEPAFLVDRRHSMITLNQALADRLGRPVQELLGRNAFAFLPDRALASARAARVDEVFARGTASVFHDLSGDRHYANHLSPVIGPDGKPWAVGVIAIDITELRAAEEQLRQKEELLRFGLQAARLGVWEWDVGADIVTVSPEAMQLLGGRSRSRQGPLAWILEYVEPEDRARMELSIRDCAEGRIETSRVTFRARPIKSKPVRWLEIQGRMFDTVAGRQRMVGTLADATARVESEERQQRSEQALQSVTQGTAGHTGRDFFRSVVEALARSVGARWVMAGRLSADGGALHSLSCWADGPAPDLVIPLAGARLESVCAQSLVAMASAGRDRNDGDTCGLAEVIGNSYVSVPIVSTDGRTLGIVAALDDKPLSDLDTARFLLALSAVRAGAEIERLDKESEIIRLNADLERRVGERTMELTAANRELEAFSYSVSHDLRAPLRSIDGFALALLEDYGSTLEPGARKYLDIVRGESQRMGQLIDDLLGLARLSRSTLVLAYVDISALAGEILDGLKRRDPQRRIETVVAPRLHAVGDARLLRIALENLIGNAWKFTRGRAAPRIEVGADGDPGAPTFYVRDNGAGFDPTCAGQLFQPFQRLHQASEYEGTGIGLATVQRIIKRHGGVVAAEGHPGKGATFRWTLPRPPHARDAAARPLLDVLAAPAGA